MYKTASSNLQRKIGRDLSRGYRPFEPRTRPQQRKYWFPVIEQHLHAGTSIAAEYGARYPGWLAAEVARLTPETWLARWSRKTGRRKR